MCQCANVPMKMQNAQFTITVPCSAKHLLCRFIFGSIRFHYPVRTVRQSICFVGLFLEAFATITLPELLDNLIIAKAHSKGLFRVC
jgi:hypothetical protein